VILSDFAHGGRIVLVSSFPSYLAITAEHILSFKVGVSDENLPLNSAQFITTNISGTWFVFLGARPFLIQTTVLTSLYGSRQDLIEVLDLVAKVRIFRLVRRNVLSECGTSGFDQTASGNGSFGEGERSYERLTCKCRSVSQGGLAARQ
jgi:hypothetical protein